MNNPQSTELIFDLSRPGRRCHRLPACDVVAVRQIVALRMEHRRRP
jgi:glycine dehydrogenase subunit 2